MLKYRIEIDQLLIIIIIINRHLKMPVFTWFENPIKESIAVTSLS